MASRQLKNQSTGGGFGQKVKSVVSAVGTIKGMYDTGRAIYGGMQVAAPYIAAGMALL